MSGRQGRGERPFEPEAFGPPAGTTEQKALADRTTADLCGFCACMGLDPLDLNGNAKMARGGCNQPEGRVRLAPLPAKRPPIDLYPVER